MLAVLCEFIVRYVSCMLSALAMLRVLLWAVCCMLCAGRASCDMLVVRVVCRLCLPAAFVVCVEYGVRGLNVLCVVFVLCCVSCMLWAACCLCYALHVRDVACPLRCTLRLK